MLPDYHLHLNPTRKATITYHQGYGSMVAPPPEFSTEKELIETKQRDRLDKIFAGRKSSQPSADSDLMAANDDFTDGGNNEI